MSPSVFVIIFFVPCYVLSDDDFLPEPIVFLTLPLKVLEFVLERSVDGQFSGMS